MGEGGGGRRKTGKVDGNEYKEINSHCYSDYSLLACAWFIIS